MAKQYLMPYTNLHELNLDWLINAMKQLEASWEGAAMNVTATASATAGTPTVKVSGSLKDTLNFDFGLPEGNSYPSDTVPKADSGTGLVGVEATFARGDHVHPSDATKLDKVTYSDETALYAVMDDKQITLPYSGFATSLEVESIENNISRLETTINTKQDKLISGTSLRTINENSLLGSGDITTSKYYPLWINASVTSEFAEQEIEITNAFDIYAILFKIMSNIENRYCLQFINKDYTIMTTSSWGGTTITRPCIKQTNYIKFYDAYKGSVVDNTTLIPIIIYGVQ